MDALISKADAIRSVSKPRKFGQQRSKPSATASSKAGPSTLKPDDRTAASVSAHTGLPRSLLPTSPQLRNAKSHAHIKNKNLRLELDRQSTKTVRAQKSAAEASLVTEAVGAGSGCIRLDDGEERTWRLGQSEIVQEVGAEAALQRREWRLDGGPYRCEYTRNGRWVHFLSPRKVLTKVQACRNR